MISRLTASATVFAALATVTLSYAVERPAVPTGTSVGVRSAAAMPGPALPVIVLPTVEVIGKRMR